MYVCLILFLSTGGTGKTSVVRDFFRYLGRPYAYVSCVQLHTVSTIVHSIIYQLPSSEESEMGAKSKARLKALDLATHLEKVAPIMGRTHYIIIDDCQRLYDGKETRVFPLYWKMLRRAHSLFFSSTERGEREINVIELWFSATENEKFFFSLLRIPEQHNVNVVFLLISPVPWAYFRTCTYPQPPSGTTSVHFAQYE